MGELVGRGDRGVSLVDEGEVGVAGGVGEGELGRGENRRGRLRRLILTPSVRGKVIEGNGAFAP